MESVKRGVQTSEFWLSLAGTIAAGLGASTGTQGLLAIALPAIYTLGRSLVKAQALKAQQRPPAPAPARTVEQPWGVGNP